MLQSEGMCWRSPRVKTAVWHRQHHIAERSRARPLNFTMFTVYSPAAKTYAGQCALKRPLDDCKRNYVPPISSHQMRVAWSVSTVRTSRTGLLLSVTAALMHFWLTDVWSSPIVSALLAYMRQLFASRPPDRGAEISRRICFCSRATQFRRP